MADTTLNPEDLLKLNSVKEGFNAKNINVLCLSVKSIPKEFLFSSIGELYSTLVNKIKVLFP